LGLAYHKSPRNAGATRERVEGGATAPAVARHAQELEAALRERRSARQRAAAGRGPARRGAVLCRGIRGAFASASRPGATHERTAAARALPRPARELAAEAALRWRASYTFFRLRPHRMNAPFPDQSFKELHHAHGKRSGIH